MTSVTIAEIKRERDLIRTAALIYLRSEQSFAALHRESGMFWNCSGALKFALKIRERLLDQAMRFLNLSDYQTRDLFWQFVRERQENAQ